MTITRTPSTDLTTLEHDMDTADRAIKGIENDLAGMRQEYVERRFARDAHIAARRFDEARYEESQLYKLDQALATTAQALQQMSKRAATLHIAYNRARLGIKSS